MNEHKGAPKLFQELLEIVDTLRGENGCPWDKKQTRETLKPLMIEELYEAFEAIDKGDEESLSEELGDMLLHIVFHARIGKEKGTFTMEEVLQKIISKMRERHPHVFGNVQAKDVQEVLKNWEEIKDRKEKRESMLASIPRHLPALLRAHAIQSRVARVGFDWQNPDEVWAKVLEELEELDSARKSNDKERIMREWGDLVFVLVNLARHLDIDPEEALRKTCNRFTKRFSFIEKELEKQGKKPSQASLEEMDSLWEKAKENSC